MSIRRRVQLGMLHVAVTLTLLPINSTLNRVMIKELSISATLVAILISLPYLFSPIQVAIGSYADRHPLLGRRRTPYVVIGLLLCLGGTLLAPGAAFELAANRTSGMAFALLAFGMWGMGYNFSTVSYFSLASEGSGERGRSATVTVMFTMMIISIIVMGMVISHVVTDYSPEALQRAFWLSAGTAAALGTLGLIDLEEPLDKATTGQPAESHTWGTLYRAISDNPQAGLFFVYLVLLLAAILGQDVLLEPFAGEAFGMSVEETTRITPLWGSSFLLAMIAAGPVQRWLNKRTEAFLASWGGIAAFLLIVLSGFLRNASLFYTGAVLLGGATGLSTISNLSLMLDMTTAENVGLFMGAWGAASAFARLAGAITGGVVRDAVTQLASNDLVLGYLVVFGLEAIFLLISIFVLRRVDVRTFHARARRATTFVERTALLGEAGTD